VIRPDPYNPSEREPRPDREQLIALMIRYLDDQLDEGQTRTLDESLKRSEENRELFVVVSMHRRLMFNSLGFELCMDKARRNLIDEDQYSILNEIIECEKLERLQSVAAMNLENMNRRPDQADASFWRRPEQPTTRVRHIVIPKALFYSAVAAIVCLSSLFVWQVLKPAGPAPVARSLEPARVQVASLVATDNAIWREPSGGTTPAMDLEIYENQPLELVYGTATLRFGSGAEVTVSAPAAFEPVAADRMRLTKGRLVGTCRTAESRGFIVDTPACRVVDTGTEFGVAVDRPDYAECHVFTGHVEVSPIVRGVVQAQSDSVSEGFAVGVSNGEVRHGIAMSNEKFGRAYKPMLVGVEALAHQPHGIMPQGLRDGVLAFRDRDYVWRDVPDFLASADYLLSGNSYGPDPNYNATLKIDLPANVYILWHPNVPAPDWLSERFERTASVIRLGGSERTGAARDLYGEERDLHYQIWHRKMDSPGVIQLGPVSQKRTSGGMYAVAVAPIDATPPKQPAFK